MTAVVGVIAVAVRKRKWGQRGTLRKRRRRRRKQT
jgi:hypothetical protein